MAQAYRLIWRQRNVDAKVNAAIKAGIDETMEACVEVAKGYAPVRTGDLRDDIAARPAEQSGNRINGRWGNWEIPYAIYQEEGTHTTPAVHYLGRAKDEEYPKTAERIKAHLDGGK